MSDSQQEFPRDQGFLLPGRDVHIPHWEIASYACAGPISPEQAELLQLLDSEATGVFPEDYLENLPFEGAELNVVLALAELGVCLVDPNTTTLFTIHPPQEGQAPVILKAYGERYEVYRCVPEIMGFHDDRDNADWSVVMRLLAILGLLRVARPSSYSRTATETEISPLRICKRLKIPHLCLPTILPDEETEGRRIVSLVTSEDPLSPLMIQSFASLMRENPIFGYSTGQGASIFVVCDEECTDEFRDIISITTASVRLGNLRTLCFRFRVDPSRFRHLLMKSPEVVKTSSSGVWQIRDKKASHCRAERPAKREEKQENVCMAIVPYIARKTDVPVVRFLNGQVDDLQAFLQDVKLHVHPGAILDLFYNFRPTNMLDLLERMSRRPRRTRNTLLAITNDEAISQPQSAVEAAEEERPHLLWKSSMAGVSVETEEDAMGQRTMSTLEFEQEGEMHKKTKKPSFFKRMTNKLKSMLSCFPGRSQGSLLVLA